ncbi:antitoxin [Methylobacterium sp. J-068]|uniref:antitoxin n=1 Tax=Methylobacterium sp. J-068 TaxID=2836649 RepID=UPI001FB897B4|nr:AbrB/MazE/SpoVT family DNA-binding domain-containing protein [Methylobacterium sp. J-068]MCJ2033088.1 AbrB/MazE/SpoVT family DNA-binding domain-containing protein [Methylobacterium sp. J-068]
MIERRVRLHRNGPSQTIEIPAEFALPGDEALLQVEDGLLTLVPLRRPSLLATLAGLSPIDEDWPEIEDRPPEAVAF